MGCEMNGVDLLVRGGVLVAAHDQDAIIDGAIAIAGQYVKEVGKYNELSLKYPDAEEIGGEDFMVLPGLINAHTHGKGLTDFQRGALDNTLETWRFDTYDKFLPLPKYEDVAYSATRLLKSGVTATMNHMLLADSTDYENKFQDAIRAYQDVGLRVLFCPAMSNNNPFVYGDNEAVLDRLSEHSRKILTAPKKAGALNADNYIPLICNLHEKYNDAMVRIGFGPTAPQWCSEDLLRSIRREADRLGLFIHTHALV